MSDTEALVYDGYEMGSHLHVSQTDTMPDGRDTAMWSRWWDRQHPDDKRGQCHVEQELRREHGLCVHNRKRTDCPNGPCRRNSEWV